MDDRHEKSARNAPGEDEVQPDEAPHTRSAPRHTGGDLQRVRDIRLPNTPFGRLFNRAVQKHKGRE
jgi:hypothetical protein